MALLVCPKTQISIDINVVTIPTAAKDSVAFMSIFPIMAASVNDKIGSDTPEINAGIASLFIYFKLMFVFTRLVHNSEMDAHFVWGSRYRPVFYSHEVHKTFDFFCFVKTYLIEQIDNYFSVHNPQQIA